MGAVCPRSKEGTKYTFCEKRPHCKQKRLWTVEQCKRCMKRAEELEQIKSTDDRLKRFYRHKTVDPQEVLASDKRVLANQFCRDESP